MNVGGIGAPYSNYPLTELPLGFSMALAQNEPALEHYAKMTESQREQIIMKCRDAKSRKEMRDIVDSLVPDNDAGLLFDEPSVM